MKNAVLFCLLLQLYGAIAQNIQSQVATAPSPVITGFKTYGYINGVRLDSVDAQYATIGWRGGSQATFDFGHFRDGKKELTVTDSKRMPLEFANTSIAFALNFFYFNGWQLAFTHYTHVEKENTLILQKRKQ